MHDVRIGRRYGYKGIGEFLRGLPMRRVVENRANTLAMLYQAQVAKRTGELARDVQVSTRIGGRENDRWVAKVTVGERIEHDLPHEFGHTTKRGKGIRGAQDLEKSLKMLRGYV